MSPARLPSLRERWNSIKLAGSRGSRGAHGSAARAPGARGSTGSASSLDRISDSAQSSGALSDGATHQGWDQGHDGSAGATSSPGWRGRCGSARHPRTAGSIAPVPEKGEAARRAPLPFAFGVEVVDSGAGLHAKDVAVLNSDDAFGHVGAGQLRGGEGTGLGLSMARQLARRHHRSQVHLASHGPDKGTCFLLRVRCAAQVDAADAWRRAGGSEAELVAVEDAGRGRASTAAGAGMAGALAARARASAACGPTGDGMGWQGAPGAVGGGSERGTGAWAGPGDTGRVREGNGVSAPLAGGAGAGGAGGTGGGAALGGATGAHAEYGAGDAVEAFIAPPSAPGWDEIGAPRGVLDGAGLAGEHGAGVPLEIVSDGDGVGASGGGGGGARPWVPVARPRDGVVVGIRGGGDQGMRVEDLAAPASPSAPRHEPTATAALVPDASGPCTAAFAPPATAAESGSAAARPVGALPAPRDPGPAATPSEGSEGRACGASSAAGRDRQLGGSPQHGACSAARDESMGAGRAPAGPAAPGPVRGMGSAMDGGRAQHATLPWEALTGPRDNQGVPPRTAPVHSSIFPEGFRILYDARTRGLRSRPTRWRTVLHCAR